MSFWDHLEELRWTLFRSVLALFVFAIAGFSVMPWLFDNVVMAHHFAVKTAAFVCTKEGAWLSGNV